MLLFSPYLLHHLLSIQKLGSHKIHQIKIMIIRSFPGGSDGKEPARDAGDLHSIPRLGRSPGEGSGYPLRYSGLENSMDCIVHGVTESDTTEQLSLHFILYQAPVGKSQVCFLSAWCSAYWERKGGGLSLRRWKERGCWPKRNKGPRKEKDERERN